MWAKARHVLVWLALAAVVGGCASAHWMAEVMAPKKPSSEPAGAQKRSTAQDGQDLEEAVQLILDLRYKEGADTLQDLLPRLEMVGDRERAGEAYFWLGYCHEKQGRGDKAAELYRKVIEEYAETRAAGMARQRLGDVAPGEGAAKGAGNGAAPKDG